MSIKNENKNTLPAQVEKLDDKTILLTLNEGKYHQVKRMFAAMGNHVVSLHREQIGDVQLDEKLELGEWRYLTKEEVASLA